MSMHPDMRALLVARIRAELQDDPAGLGYAGKSAAEVKLIQDAVVAVETPAGHRDVGISDVEGYLRARLLVTRLRAWAAGADGGVAKDAALELLDIIASPRLMNLSTSTDSGRANILGLFGLLVQAGAGGLTAANLDDLTEMTVAAAAPATITPPRWVGIIEGIAEAPNAADIDMIAEALA